MIRDAVISSCGQFRYSLTREWMPHWPRLLFVMLNPSTANAFLDDNTVRKCIAFAETLGYGSLEIVNVWAYRTKSPSSLKAKGWLVGPENDDHIIQACLRAERVICAWGGNANDQVERVDRVTWLIRTFSHNEPMALRKSKTGTPYHPLYLSASLVPILL